MRPEDAVREWEAYRVRMNLNKAALAKLMGIPTGTVNGWLSAPDMVRYALPSAEGVRRIQSFLARTPGGTNGHTKQLAVSMPAEHPARQRLVSPQKLTAERVSRLRQLFLLAAQDLEALRNGNEADRAMYRSILDPRDLGYLSSLMSMLCDEAQFERWQQFNTYRFRQFKQTEGE